MRRRPPPFIRSWNPCIRWYRWLRLQFLVQACYERRPRGVHPLMTAMFRVAIQRGETMAEITIPSRQTELRYLQKPICRAFGERFPRMAATLHVGHMVYDDFAHVPFAAGRPTGPCVVVFEESDDPFWYDYADRKCKGPNLEEEMRQSVPAVLPTLAGIRALD